MPGGRITHLEDGHLPARRTVGVGLGLTSQAFSIFSSLISLSILAHGLGPEGRGIVAGILAPLTIIIAISSGSLANAVTYFTAKYPRSSLVILLKTSTLLFFVTLPMIIVAWCIEYWLNIENASDRDLSLPLIVLMFSLPGGLLILMRSRAAALRLWGIQATESILTSMAKIFVLFFLLNTENVSVLTATFVLSAEMWLGIIFYLPGVFINSRQSNQVRSKISTIDIFIFSVKGWPGVIGGAILGQGAQLLIIPLSGSIALGEFVIAMTIAGLISQIGVSFRKVVFAVETANLDPKRIAQSARISLVSTSVVAGILAVSLPWLLPIIAGQGFQSAVLASEIMLIFVVLNSSGSIANSGLLSLGKPGLAATTVVLGATTYISMLFVLVPSYGAIGASIATLSQAIPGVLSILIFCRHTAMPIWSFFIPKKSDYLVLMNNFRNMITAKA